MHFNVILTFGIILAAGYFAGKIANLLKLPKITGYITAGILLEPSVSGILPVSFIDNSDSINNFALCIITYAIGGSLCFSKIKKLGKTIVWMTFFEAEMAFLFVFLGLLVLLPLLIKVTGLPLEPKYFIPLALLAGALASPTDPTAALAVKEEYKADGPVTRTILGIAAFDDALGIINFSIATAASIALLGGTTGLNATFVAPILKIIFSIMTGVVTALVLLYLSRKTEERGTLIVLIFGAIFICFGVANFLNLDELLSTMALGCVVVNIAKDHDKHFISIRDYFEELVFVIFFVLAGAHLKLNVLKHSIWIVACFTVLRISGKIIGTYIGGVISNAEKTVKKYTAFGLIPQGGIVVGLVLLIRQESYFSDLSALLLNIILGATVFHEFIGPLFAEFAIKRSDEKDKDGLFEGSS